MNLRGGGSCVSTKQNQSLQVSQLLVTTQFYEILNQCVQNISKYSNESQNYYDEILQNLQILNSYGLELNNLTKSLNQLSKQINSLEKQVNILIEACLVINQYQLKWLTMQIIQKMSRTIFWYYCFQKSVKDGYQQSYINQLNKIEQQNNIQDHFYKTLIEYEIFICKIIFTILPNDIQEGLELISIFTSICNQLNNTLSKTIKETIKSGVVQQIRDSNKVQYRKIYKQIFTIDTIKYWVINEFKQPTKELQEILQELQEYSTQLSKSDQYVQQCWISALGEILSYKHSISEDQIQIQDNILNEFINKKYLIKMNRDYKILLNYEKLKNENCQQIIEYIPQFNLIKSIQENIITKEQFYNRLYEIKQENNEIIKQKQQTTSIFNYLFSLFTECDIEIYIDLIRKINQQYVELKENISLIKQISLSKWIKMVDQKSLNDQIVFGEFQQKQKQIKNLLYETKRVQNFFIQLDFIFYQWNQFGQILDNDQKLENCYQIFLENEQNQNDCQSIVKQNLENMKQLQLLSIELDVYFDFITEFIQKLYQQIYIIVEATQSNEPILNLYKQYKDVQDAIQLTFRKINEKIIQYKEILTKISGLIISIEANCVLKFYNICLKLQHFDLSNIQFEYRNQDHQNLFYIQSYENKILKYQIMDMHQEYKELITNNAFNDLDQAKVYLKTIQYVCFYLQSTTQQSKKLLQHIQNYKLSIQLENDSSKYTQLLNQWKSILQIIQTLESDFDQSSFSTKYDQMFSKYETILILNKQIRWPYNQYIQQYFHLIIQIDTTFKELNLFKSFNVNNDQVQFKRYEILQSTLKQACQSQIQRVKSSFDQYTLTFDQQQTRLECFKEDSLDSFLILLNNLNDALNETLQKIALRSSQSIQPVGNVNLISNQRKLDFENLFNYKFNIENISISSFLKFNFNFIELNAVLQGINQNIQGKTQENINNAITIQFPLRILLIIVLNQIWNSCLGEEEFKIISLLITKIRLNETDQIIKNEFKGILKQDMEKIIIQTLNDQSQAIENDLRRKIQERNQLSFQIKFEPSFEKSEILIEQCKIQTQQLSQIFDNFEEIEKEYGIQIHFYHKLMREFKKAEQNTQTLDVSEIMFYQGKQLTDLFLLRIDYITRIINISQIRNKYIELQCQLYDQNLTLFNNKDIKNSIIDRFLEDTQITTQLILFSGQAGSGKSTSIKMIEEYVWKRNDPIKIIPIIIKLSELKDPINNAINETLRSLSYKFDQTQIEQLQKEVKQNKIQMFFIFEEYDKLSHEFIHINIFDTNQLQQWQTPILSNTPKILLSTRSELFKYKEHLQWIEQLYWDVKILPFNQEQRIQFFQKYQEMHLRNIVMQFYQMMSQFNHPDLLIQNFISLWKKIDLNINENTQQGQLLLNSQEIQKILDALKNDSKIKQLDENILQFAQEQLEQQKSSLYYQNMFETLNYSIQLDNPQTLQIFIQSLPKLLNSLSQIEKVKENLFEIFLDENYTLNCDITQVKSILERDWNQLTNSRFFKFYNAEESITKISILLAECFRDDQQYQNKLLRIFKKFKITSYQLYEQNLMNYFEIQIMRILLIEYSDISIKDFINELWNFSIKLALKLSENETFSIHYNSQGSLIKETGSIAQWEEFFDDQNHFLNSNQSLPKKIFRSAIPLRDQFSIFGFQNKIVQEFLVAKGIIEQIQLINENEKMEDIFINSILNKKNIQTSFFQGTIHFIVLQCQSMFSIKQNLIKIIKYFSQINEYILLTSNSFYLLINIQNDLKEIDLSNIRIQNLQLNQLNLNHCNLSNSIFNNIRFQSFSLIKNNMQQFIGEQIQCDCYLIREFLKSPLYFRSFNSSYSIFIYDNYVETNQKEILFQGYFRECKIIQIQEILYIITKQNVYSIKLINNNYITNLYNITNIKTISQFDNKIMLLKIINKIDISLFEIDLKNNQISQEIKFSNNKLNQLNIQEVFNMEGNQLIILTKYNQVQIIHYQIENKEIILDNPITTVILNIEDSIINIEYYKKLDLTVVTCEDQVSLKQYNIIYGTINQLQGQFIQIEQFDNSFLYLNQNILQLINQSQFKVIDECQIQTSQSILLYHIVFMYKNQIFLIFTDQIIILSISPFKIIKQIEIIINDAKFNVNEKRLELISGLQMYSFDLQYLIDKRNKIQNKQYQFDDIHFISSSNNFIGKIKNHKDIVIATNQKSDIIFKKIGQADESGIYLSNDENIAYFRDQNKIILYDIKNDVITKIIPFFIQKILWIKDNSNFFYINQGNLEEFRNTAITLKNKISTKQLLREIKSIQSTFYKLYISTSNGETIILDEKNNKYEITTKPIVKRYRKYYITQNDLRIENDITIQIKYKSKNELIDFWIFDTTILLREKTQENQIEAILLLDLENYQLIEKIILSIDFIAFTKNQIQIISKKSFWQSFSCYDLNLLQSQFLNINTLFMNSNHNDQLMFISQTFDIILWNINSYQIIYQNKSSEIIQYVKLIPNKQNQYYLVDRDVLKFYINHQSKFSIQLSKKRLQLITNIYNDIHHIYQVEENKITLYCMSEENKVLGWKKTIFELDCQREKIQCFDNKDYKLVYVADKKIQQLSLDAFEETKILEIPNQFNALEIKYNRDCSLIYLRSIDRIIIIDSVKLINLNSILFVDILSTSYHLQDQISIYSLQLNNLLIKHQKAQQYCYYNYSINSQQLDLIKYSKYDQFVGIDNLGFTLIDMENGTIEEYQQKIIDINNNYITYTKFQTHNKTNLATCQIFENNLQQAKFQLDLNIDLVQLWKQNKQVV